MGVYTGGSIWADLGPGKAASGGGRELVGKWCKGGSFAANSGGKLTAKSNSGTVASYALEKRNHPNKVRDPMICLDGDCYTSFWQKAAW